MQNEKWLAVVGWEGLYEVSDLGRVKSLRRGTILKPSYSNAGGYGVVIFSLNGRSFGRYIEAFVEPCPDGMETRHLDGDPKNAALSNLTWGSSSENKFDQVRHGTYPEASRDHCVNGHEFTPENTLITYSPDGSIKRRACRACHNQRTKERYRARLISGKICTEDGCNEPLWVKGLCTKHYAQQWKANRQ